MEKIPFVLKHDSGVEGAFVTAVNLERKGEYTAIAQDPKTVLIGLSSEFRIVQHECLCRY